MCWVEMYSHEECESMKKKLFKLFFKWDISFFLKNFHLYNILSPCTEVEAIHEERWFIPV